ncbi:MAG: MFS transporter [Deltaproteobacteria bacterium]|nr:MFS transporter [Candidatus Zymogenaceae bacterium]
MAKSGSKSPLFTGPLTMAEIILYNLAGLAFNVYDTVLYSWVNYFYNPPEGSDVVRYLPAAAFTIAAILFGGRILDAVTDPLIGYWSDHTKSRWGRRKPYIFIANPILFLAFIFVWTPPAAGASVTNIIYLTAVLFVYYWAYTAVLIPWFAVLPEMSPKKNERAKIASIGVALGILGALIAGGLYGTLISRFGVFAMALILGAVAFIAGELSLLGIKQRHRIDESEKLSGFFGAMKEAFADRQIFSFAAMITLVQLTYQLMLMNTPYLVTLILKRPDTDSSILVAEVVIAMAVSIPLWYFLVKRYPKRQVFRGVIIAMIAGFALSFFIGDYPLVSPFVQAMIIFPVAAIPLGGVFLMSLLLIADLTDYGELKTGKRKEAIYYGIYGFVRKTGWALSAVILNGVLAAFGYSAENPTGVKVVWVVCAASCLVGLLLFAPYKIGDTKEETKKIMNL